jgi:hypothetical protein
MKSKKKIHIRKLKTRKKNIGNRQKRTQFGGETTPPTSDFTAKLINRILILIEGLVLESIGQLGNVIGIDVSNPQQVNAKLSEIQFILSDPEINEKVRIIVGKMSVLLTVALEAAEPYIKPLADKLNTIYVKSTSDLGKSTIAIIKNIAKAIPIYGAIVSLIDSANTVAVTSADTLVAQQHATLAVNEAINKMSDDFTNLLKQKQDLLARIPSSQI